MPVDVDMIVLLNCAVHHDGVKPSLERIQYKRSDDMLRSAPHSESTAA